jgi:hypothetical protein
MKIHEHNAMTGEIVERDATAEELANAKASEAATKARHLEETTAAAAKEAAQTKLAALGLTADDLKALGL